MEYKEFFEKALSDAENRYPPSDVGTALDNITKRAGTAENVNIRARGGFVSAAPTASERFHSVLTAAGYIAGAAAVLAGCFFGLKFVIENGGLKEGGPGGSNPSVTVAATSEHEAAPTADPGHPATTAGNDAAGEPTPTLGMWRVPEEPVYRFNGFSCKFTQYWYDGMTLYLSYEITFDGGVPEKYKSDAVIRENELPGSFANDVILQAVHGDVRIRPEEKTTVHVRDDKTVSVSWQHTNCELMRSMDIMVMTSDASKYPADMTEPYYVYTVTMPDDMGGYSIDLGVPVSQPNGDTITLKHIDICKYTVGFVFDGKWKDEYELNADIVWLYDDTPVNMTLDGSRPFFSANDDSYHYLLYRQSTPSPELIKSVIINGTETDLEDWLSIPEAVPEADKDEWEKEQTRQAFYYPFFAINTIPDSLLALAEPNELEKWELMSVDITKDPPESITDYANICTFIAHFGISPEDAENALGDEYREYIERMWQNSEEADRVIDIICSGELDESTVGELVNNTTWSFGGRLICPNWLYVHSLDEWKAAGVKAATVSTMYDYYINNDVLNEEQTAEFKAKIDQYIAENKQDEVSEYVYDEDGDVVPNAVVAPNEPVTDDELKALIEQGPEVCGLSVTVSDLTRGSLKLNYKLDENAPFAGIWYLEWYDHYEIQVQNASGEWETYDPEGYEMFFSNGTIFDGIHELGTLYDEFRGEEKQTVLFYGNYVFGDMYESELPNGKYRIMKKLSAYSTATGEYIGSLTVSPEFEINDLTQNIFDIVLSVSNVSPEGVTVEAEQDGRDFLYMKNTIGYRPAFTLQRYENGRWVGVPTKDGGIPSWNDAIYPVTVGGKIEINRDFSNIYGSLTDGRYRISTTFVNYWVDHSGITSILNESVYYIEFNIENYRPSNFGITLEAAEVSPEEVTCRIKQSGGTIKGSLGYLAEWYAEKETDNGSWEKLESNPTLWAPDITAVPLGGSTARRFKLAEEYGKLKNGHYRIWFDFIDYTPTSGSPEAGNVTKNSSESLCFDFNITDGEKDWGLTLSVKDDVTAEGLTLVISQRGGSLTGELEYGEPYSIERKNGDKWEALEYLGGGVWNDLAYIIEANSDREEKLDWRWLYGTLPAGTYRIAKEFTDYRAPGDRDTQMYYAAFRITEDMASKLGIALRASKYNARNMTLQIMQVGDTGYEKIGTNPYRYTIERKKGGKWQSYYAPQAGVPTPDLGLKVKNSGVTEYKLDWSEAAGSLPVGDYRLGMTFSCGDITETRYCEFTVVESMTNEFGISVNAFEVSKTGVKLGIDSRGADMSGRAYYDKDLYTIEKKGSDGKWQNVVSAASGEMHTGMISLCESGYAGLADTINWSGWCGELVPGNYRISLKFYTGSGDSYKEITLYAEFVITDDTPEALSN